jgi:hypothetical protein
MKLYYIFPDSDNILEIDCYHYEVIPNDENNAHFVYFSKRKAKEFNKKMYNVNNVSISAPIRQPILCWNIFYNYEAAKSFLKNNLIKEIIE